MALRRSRVQLPSSPPNQRIQPRSAAACLVKFSAIEGYHSRVRNTYQGSVRGSLIVLEKRMRFKNCKGQSVAEYAVVLALIAIIATTVLLSIGQRSRDRLASISAVNAEGDPGKAGAASGGDGKAVAAGNSRHDANDQDSENAQEDAPASKTP